ncbi:MAG: ABC transporter permease [Gemmatimonas sp.]
MSLIDGWSHRVRQWVNPQQHDRDLNDELSFHVEREAAQLAHNSRAPISAQDALVAARRQIGNLTWVREETRRVAGLATVDAFLQDVRFAVRSFRSTPAFTAIVVITLALGIGFTAAIYSAVNALLLRPLPFREPQQLMSVSLKIPGVAGRREIDNRRWSYPKVVAFRAAQSTYTDVTAWTLSQFTVRLGDKAHRVGGEYTDSRYLPTLGIGLALGKNFPNRDSLTSGAEVTVILGYALWRDTFGADSAIIGKTLQVDGFPFTVVGVAAAKFRGVSGEADFWMAAAAAPSGWGNSDPYNHSYFLLGRLKPGVTVAQATVAAAQVGAQVDAQFPSRDQSLGHWSAVAHELDGERTAPNVRKMLYILLGAVLLMLLTACANVANLLLVRASARQREVAVRLALGATRARLARQLLAESVVLALAGGVGSLFVGYTSVKMLASVQTLMLGQTNGFTGLGTAYMSAIQFDFTAFAVTASLALATGLIFGFAPALHATRTSLLTATKDSGNTVTIGPRRFTMRHALTIAEISFAVVLLAGSGLMIRSVNHLMSVRPGFDAAGILALRVNRAPEWSRDSITTYYDGVMARLSETPGVSGVAMSDCPPLARCGSADAFLADRPRPSNERMFGVGMHFISPEFPSLLKIPLIHGRAFTRHDDERAPRVALVSERAAKRLWNGDDPIGRPLAFSTATNKFDTATVVGIVGDVLYDSMDSRPVAEVYVSYYQTHFTYRMMLFVQARNSASNLTASVVNTLHAFAPGFPVHEIGTLDSRVNESMTNVRVTTGILTIFAVVALLLAMMGTYGVVAYTVSQRTREIGVRVALGATSAHISKLVLWHAVSLAAIGLGVGMAVAIVATTALRSMLYEVAPSDPVTLVGIVVLLGASVLAATWFPARKAMRVMPASVMRAQ